MTTYAGCVSRKAWAVDVDRALRTLSRDQQAFLRLSYFDGLDQPRIAERAGVPLAVVSKTIAAGLQSLGLALESLLNAAPAAGAATKGRLPG